ncbi:hypothetical protein FOZ61_009731 [Perkinsus olseni]|uniref:Uncharacterized protein n=1 Tax=Perkinsus olseni TaxID=32597 RepID=A0A7J6L0L9_PEROL|nr:hypothetical protein FOZ61_009731 [Perkinsus olseni]
MTRPRPGTEDQLSRHHRVSLLRLGDLNLVVRAEVDACVGDPAGWEEDTGRVSEGGWSLREEGSSSLWLQEVGSFDPRQTMVELKSASTQRSLGVRAVYQQMLLGGCHKLVLGKHDWGRVVGVIELTIEEPCISAEDADFRDRMMTQLGRLVELLLEIVKDSRQAVVVWNGLSRKLIGAAAVDSTASEASLSAAAASMAAAAGLSSGQVLIRKAPQGKTHVYNLAFNRPDVRNAITLEMMTDLSRAAKYLSGLPQSECRAVVLSGEGKSFCAGRDLKASRNFTPEQAKEYLQGMKDGVKAVLGLPMPVIAAVHGHAMGGGLEFALASDLRVASPATVLRLPETALGLIPGIGGCVLLPLMLPIATALDMVYTSRPVQATEAFNLGLVNRLTESDSPEDVYNEALELASAIAANGPLAVRAAKRVIRKRQDEEFPPWLESASAEREPLTFTKDHQSALDWFAAKKSPPAPFEGM